jgi:hypothetical protein
MLAMQGTRDVEGKRNYSTPFDTDSVLLRVDNCASACMSPYKEDFITPLVPISKKVKGIGGTIKGIMQGTMRLTIEDDKGVPHDIIVPGSYYVPDCPLRLLSPQHWAQKAKDNHPKPHGTWCATYDDEIVLEWHQRQHRRTIKLDQKGMNTGWIFTAPGYKRYHAFSAEVQEDIDKYSPSLAYQSTMVTDDEHEPEADDQALGDEQSIASETDVI